MQHGAGLEAWDEGMQDEPDVARSPLLWSLLRCHCSVSLPHTHAHVHAGADKQRAAGVDAGP